MKSSDDAMLFFHATGHRVCECRLSNGEIPRVEWQIFLEEEDYFMQYIYNADEDEIAEMEYEEEYDYILECLVEGEDGSRLEFMDLKRPFEI
jgi:hypothetical protein